MTQKLKKYLPIPGIIFLLLVVGLLIYGHMAKPDVPRKDIWTAPPDILICSDAPEWVWDSLDKALGTLEGLGYKTGKPVNGLCSQSCNVEGQAIPCSNKVVAITGGESWKDPDHAGECFRSVAERDQWATVRVPRNILPSDVDAPVLPGDIKALVLTHELAHCVAGYDHVLGPPLLPGVRLSSPTGHLMNPSTYKIGWSLEAM